MQVHNDDISNVLILNKKSITNHEQQLFKAELEKFRPHQNRILQANHKQTSLMKELTRTYSDLLQDKRVRAEQNKYEAFSRQRNSIMKKYQQVFQAFNDLVQGLMRAQSFYSEMNDTVENLKQNVDAFVENRRAEGSQLLADIEAAKASNGNTQADQEQQRLKAMMDRLSVNPSASPSHFSPLSPQQQSSYGKPAQSPYPGSYNPISSPPITPRYPQQTLGGSYSGMQSPSYNQPQHSQHRNGSYQQRTPQPQQPQQYQQANYYTPVSPAVPSQQPPFSPTPNQQQQQHQYGGFALPNLSQQYHHQQQHPLSSLPAGYVPPPPPPGPPPAQDYNHHLTSPGGYGRQLQQRQGPGQPPPAPPHQGHNDPWAGLSGWR